MVNRIIEDEKDTPEKTEFKKRIKDWGLRHSTLEEVFMKVRQFLSIKNLIFFRFQNKISKFKISCNYFIFTFCCT